MTLVTRYALAGVPKRSGRLLVVNVHGTNFRGPRAFSRQIKGVIEAVGKHNGPVLMAGDFNTWSEDRIDELRKLARRAGLAEVEFGEGRKQFMGNALDRMFVRDLRVLTRRVRSDVRSSDHRPLEAELAYEPAAAAD